MGAWQEEKDKLDRKKVVIFAEGPQSSYDFSQVNIPYELKKELNPMDWSEKLRDWFVAEGSTMDMLLPDDWNEEALYISDFDKRKKYTDLIRTGEMYATDEYGNREAWLGYDEDYDWKGIADIMKADPDLNMEWADKYGRGDFPEHLIDKEADVFGSQAEWWKQTSGPDTDVEILNYRGKVELEEELKKLYKSGFLTDESDIDAIIMGHADSEGMYGGVMPAYLGEMLDKYHLDKKFDDVFLGSCGMGTNPLACMSLSEAFDGAKVWGQGDPNAPKYIPNTDEIENWSHFPQWGTGSIDPDKISDPNAPMYQRILSKNAPVQTFQYDKILETAMTDAEKQRALEELYGSY